MPGNNGGAAANNTGETPKERGIHYYQEEIQTSKKEKLKKTTIDQPIHYDHPLGAPPFLYVNPEHFSGAKQFI